MTVIISQSISTKVGDRAEIKLVIPGSAVGLATDCVMGPGSIDSSMVPVTFPCVENIRICYFMSCCCSIQEIKQIFNDQRGFFINFKHLHKQVINKLL